MTAILTIARLTIKEAIRRRVFIASILIALIFVLMAFLHVPVRPDPMTGMVDQSAHDNLGKVWAWLGCGMIKFFSSVLAVTLTAGTISAEVERGVLSVIVPKPLSRAEIYFGKWLGLLCLLLASIALWASLLIFAIWHQTHTFHPHILLGILATCLFPLLFMSLTLFFSSFANFALSAGLALIAAGISLAEDILLFLSRMLGADVLKTISQAVGYIVPIGKMNHWITRGLGDAGIDLSSFASRGGPSTVATTNGDLIYIICYIVFFLICGVIIFQKRDL
jgi:Cu-processing system permease protein